MSEGGAICYGMTGIRTIVLAKTTAGQWKVVFDEISMASKLGTRTNGWLNIQGGGPGMGPPPVFRFDGAKYDLRR